MHLISYVHSSIVIPNLKTKLSTTPYHSYCAGKIANALDEYKQGAKIKNLGIICKVVANYYHL